MQDQEQKSRETLGGAAQETGAHGHDAATGVKETVEREMKDARAKLSGASEDLRREAAGAGETISTMVSEQAERRKEEAADGLRAFAGAIREASDDLGERDRSISARFVQEAAHGLERFSDSLQSRSINDMTRSVATFGRENPATFLSVCLLAGVAAGRFLIASGARSTRSGGGDAWRDDGYGSSDREGYGASSQGGGGHGGGAAMAAGGFAERGGRGAGVYAEGGSRRDEGLTGAGVLGEGGPDVTRQAGTFGAVSPSSEQHAPGDMDALSTRADNSGPSFPPGPPIDQPTPAEVFPEADVKKDDRDGDR